MKQYAVAIQLIRTYGDGKEHIVLKMEVIEAISPEHALGILIAKEKSTDYRIGAFKSMEIPEISNTNNMKNLFKLVHQWVIDRNLHTQDPKIQMCKVVEELGETAKAILKALAAKSKLTPGKVNGEYLDQMVNVKDGIGDTFVTLICLAAQLGLDAEECLAAAYDVIKDRRGKLIDGVFIKEEDLKNG